MIPRYLFVCMYIYVYTHTHPHTGPSLGGMAKARTGAQKPEVEKIMGQHHVFYFADGLYIQKKEKQKTKKALLLLCRRSHAHT